MSHSCEFLSLVVEKFTSLWDKCFLDDSGGKNLPVSPKYLYKPRVNFHLLRVRLWPQRVLSLLPTGSLKVTNRCLPSWLTDDCRTSVSGSCPAEVHTMVFTPPDSQSHFFHTDLSSASAFLVFWLKKKNFIYWTDNTFIWFNTQKTLKDRQWKSACLSHLQPPGSISDLYHSWGSPIRAHVIRNSFCPKWIHQVPSHFGLTLCKPPVFICKVS